MLFTPSCIVEAPRSVPWKVKVVFFFVKLWQKSFHFFVISGMWITGYNWMNRMSQNSREIPKIQSVDNILFFLLVSWSTFHYKAYILRLFTCQIYTMSYPIGVSSSWHNYKRTYIVHRSVVYRITSLHNINRMHSANKWAEGKCTCSSKPLTHCVT